MTASLYQAHARWLTSVLEHAQSLADFAGRAAGSAVTVRTTDAVALAALLGADGASVRMEGPDRLTVTGTHSGRIGEIATTHRITLHELTTHTASLEDAFMRLTGDSVEYRAGGAR